MPECRFCLIEDKIDNVDYPLVSPCKCRGSAEFVHIKCLEKWRSTDLRDNQHYLCPVCNTKYNSDLVLFQEIIPELTGSLSIKIIFNPFIIPVMLNYLYLCLVSGRTPLLICNNNYNETNYICNYDESILQNREVNTQHFYIYYYLLQTIHTGFYLGLYLCFYRQVESKRRYFKHSLKFLVLPMFHLFFLSFINRYMYLVGTINQVLLPLYLKRHINILKSMNEQL